MVNKTDKPNAGGASALPRESVVMTFRNGCVAVCLEQEDGTYKIVIQGDMYPRHLRLITEVVELFKECSKEDRPKTPKAKGKRRDEEDYDY